MARLEGSVMRGKLGDVIYSTWHGRPYTRRRPKQVANPKTEAQEAHRNNFTKLVKLASEMKEAHRIGLHKQAIRWKLDSSNTFKKLNKDHVRPEGIKYNLIEVSRGILDVVHIVSAKIDDQRMLQVTFEGLITPGNAADDFYLFAYCPELHIGKLSDPVHRSVGSLSLELPEDWLSHPLYFYAFLRGKNWHTSPTIYVSLK